MTFPFCVVVETHNPARCPLFVQLFLFPLPSFLPSPRNIIQSPSESLAGPVLASSSPQDLGLRARMDELGWGPPWPMLLVSFQWDLLLSCQLALLNPVVHQPPMMASSRRLVSRGDRSALYHACPSRGVGGPPRASQLLFHRGRLKQKTPRGPTPLSQSGTVLAKPPPSFPFLSTSDTHIDTFPQTNNKAL